MAERKGLRKREIVFAVAAGALAAGGAALVLEASADPEPVVSVEGPGEMDYQLSGFDEISTTGPLNLVITSGEEFSVRAEGSPQALSVIEPVVENGRLEIGPKRGLNWSNWRNFDEATFYITMPRLTGVSVAGSGDVEIDRIEAESFEGSIAGSGELLIGAMAVDRASFDIAGAGNVEVTGTARDTRVSIGGSGDIDGAGLSSRTASVDIAGSGDVSLTVQDRADVSILGGGDVDIAGPAQCSVSRLGGGEVRCGGGSDN
jgi:hypothetical protein